MIQYSIDIDNCIQKKRNNVEYRAAENERRQKKREDEAYRIAENASRQKKRNNVNYRTAENERKRTFLHDLLFVKVPNNHFL